MTEKRREYHCAFCSKLDSYPDDGKPTPDNLICEACFRSETEANERDEEIQKYYMAEQAKRYANIRVLDNDVNKVRVFFHRRILFVADYSDPPTLFTPSRDTAMVSAKGYVEGWCDAVAACERVITNGRKEQ